MWLEFTYTGQKASQARFAVLAFLPSDDPPSHDLPFSAQINYGCIRIAEEVLAENPQLQIMRDPPPLIGKRVRYITVFHLEEEGKPRQTLLRARAWALPKNLDPYKDRPTGWDDAVYKVIRSIFTGTEEGEGEEFLRILPVDSPPAQLG